MKKNNRLSRPLILSFLVVVVESFNYQGLCKALEQVSIFEKQANSRVIELGVLKGLDMEDVKGAGEHLLLQNGCMKFFQQVVERKVELNVDIHLISYCWCGDIIRSAFSSGTFDCFGFSPGL